MDPSRPLRQLGQQNWQTDSGLPQNTVHATLQTRDGFLWLATEGGLVRFDGTDFVVFDKRTTPVLRSNLFFSLAEDAQGSLWAATAEGLLQVRAGHMRLFTTQDGLPSDSVLSVLPSSSAGLWILTSNGVASFRDGTLHATPPLAPAVTANDQPVSALAADGTLWVATRQSVVRLAPGRVLESVPVAQAQTLAVASDGTLWIATGARLLHLIQHRLQPAVLPPGTLVTSLLAGPKSDLIIGTNIGLALERNGLLARPHPPSAAGGKAVQHLFRDRSGALWMTTGSALTRFADPATLGQAQTLPLGGVLSLYEDREGDLWLGTDASGLNVLREQKFSTWTTADGLAGNSVRTVIGDGNGDVWAGTSGNGLSRLRGAAWSTYSTHDGLASDTILSLATATDGSLFIGTPDGLDRLAGPRATAFPAEDGLPDDLVRSIHADAADGSVWIGTRRGLARWVGGNTTGGTTGTMTLWTRQNGLGSDVVGALEPETSASGAIASGAISNAMWIGTLGGLSHYAAGRITNFSTRDGLSSNTITALLEDSTHTLWIGTNGGGLNLFQDGHILRAPSAASGLPETISSILEDTRGYLWLGSPSGIYRVNRQQLADFARGALHHIDVSAYGTADGMRISECSSGHPSAVRTADGTLWFATLKGLSFINPERTRDNTLPPPVAIEAVTIDDLPVAAGKQFRVPAGSTRLAIHYAGLSFVAPSKVRYRYRMEGFDRRWIDAGGRRTAYYTNLAPGRYTFRVLAANNDGVWNETGAALSFRVQPHYYQTWWFYILIALGLCALGYEFYRIRVRQVELRFGAVLAERNRIAREIHDTLAQDIVGIGMQLELASRLLTSSVDAARTQLDQTRALVKSSLAEARSSIWNLRSHSAENTELPARVAQAVTHAAEGAPAKLLFAVHGTYRVAPRNVEDQLLRIAQEAVANAVRHAQAQHIEVGLNYDAISVRLLVADDGRGFTADLTSLAASGHFGLRGMQERAKEIGGRMVIDSAPAEGTRISVAVDIP
ncbi:MAG: sensor histidine kinase [Acidobacteriaceae bacterium]